jgi:hypothetical protein
MLHIDSSRSAFVQLYQILSLFFLFSSPILTLGRLGVTYFHLSCPSRSVLTWCDIVVSMLLGLCSLLNKSTINWAELNWFRARWSCCSKSAHFLQSDILIIVSLLVRLLRLLSVHASTSAILITNCFCDVQWLRTALSKGSTMLGASLLAKIKWVSFWKVVLL